MPDDIVIKGLFESCADLNTVGGCSLAIQYCWGSSFGADKLALAACGFKLLTAYFGQFRSGPGALQPRTAAPPLRVSPRTLRQPHAPSPPPWHPRLHRLSHRESHARYQNKTRVGKWMQAKGLMISTADHHVHHTDPHDSNFWFVRSLGHHHHQLRADNAT